MKGSKHFRVLALAAAVLVALPASFADTRAGRTQPGESRVDVVETFAKRAPGNIDLEDDLQQRDELHRWLSSERVKSNAAIVVDVRAADLAPLEAEQVTGAPLRVGIVQPVGTVVSLADLEPSALGRSSRSRPHGAVRGTYDGGYVHTVTVRSPGATGLRLHFTDFWLPGSAELYVYTAKEAFGPYTGFGPHDDGDFWSHSVMGEEVHVQIRHHGLVTRSELRDTWFTIADIGYLTPKMFGLEFGDDPAEKTFCSYNVDCIEPAGSPQQSCNGDSPVDDARYAMAHMQWVTGPYINFCTGGLLNDTIGSGTPLFLTANHCISRGKDAKNMEAFFQHWLDGCSTTCPSWSETRSNHPQSLRTLGATILDSSTTSDHTLMELKEAAPGGSVFMGWTNAPVANTNGTPLYRISHPSAAPQAYSAQTVSTSRGTCGTLPRGEFIYSGDTFGGTEGGSSGSPVVNGNGQVVGQLFGACGTNVNDACDSASNATVDGALAHYYGSVEQWLDPAGGCVPSTEVCDDGQDNDCDGAVDCDDANCSGDPGCQTGGCGGHRDACTEDADCCSNDCRRGRCKGN